MNLPTLFETFDNLPSLNVKTTVRYHMGAAVTDHFANIEAKTWRYLQ